MVTEVSTTGYLNYNQLLYFKRGCSSLVVEEMVKMNGWKRFMVVTTKAIAEQPFYNDFLHLFSFENCIISQCLLDNGAPNSEEIEVSLREASNFGPDCIIGLGGGSVIDIAKITWWLFENQKTLDQLENGAQKHQGRRRSALCAWPTTFTGGHVTPYAVYRHNNQIKCITDAAIIPTISCFDVQYVADLSPELVRNSTMHAFARVLDSVFTGTSSEFTVPSIGIVMKLIFENLPIAMTVNPHNLSAREHLCNAATLAGQATTNTNVGILGEVIKRLYFVTGKHYGASATLLIPAFINLIDDGTKQRIEEIAANFFKMSVDDFLKSICDFCANLKNGEQRIDKADLSGILKEWKRDDLDVELARKLLDAISK